MSLGDLLLIRPGTAGKPDIDAYPGMQGINSSSMETLSYQAADPPSPGDGVAGGGSSCRSRDRKD